MEIDWLKFSLGVITGLILFAVLKTIIMNIRMPSLTSLISKKFEIVFNPTEPGEPSQYKIYQYVFSIGRFRFLPKYVDCMDTAHNANELIKSIKGDLKTFKKHKSDIKEPYKMKIEIKGLNRFQLYKGEIVYHFSTFEELKDYYDYCVEKENELDALKAKTRKAL